MLNNYIEILFLIKYPLIGLFLTFAILSFCWNPIFTCLNLKAYNNIQRVHKDEVARLGGLIIYLLFWLIYIFDFIRYDLLYNLLVSALPIVLISIKDDLFHNSSPKNRLLLMILGCLIFFHINPIIFPTIELPYLEKIISFYPISIIFFTFSILVFMNGMNLIDGMNGLFGFTAFFQLISLAFLAYTYGDYAFMKIALFFSMPLVIFLFFNFPFGKIFIGDMGAYFYGFLISILSIIFFGKNPDIISWLAVWLLFYPCIELLFSIIRKIKSRKNPFDPDKQHLHSIIFDKFINYNYDVNNSNYFSTLTLFIFWLSPVSIIFISLDNIYLIICLIVIFTLLYLFFYRHFKQ